MGHLQTSFGTARAIHTFTEQSSANIVSALHAAVLRALGTDALKSGLAKQSLTQLECNPRTVQRSSELKRNVGAGSSQSLGLSRSNSEHQLLPSMLNAGWVSVDLNTNAWRDGTCPKTNLSQNGSSAPERDEPHICRVDVGLIG
jgi:hypothetical protein